MTRLGEKLRVSVVGQLVARADEAERQRDDARGAKDQALSQLAAVREAHEIGQRAAAKLDGSIEAARAVLREGGHLTYSSLSLANDVSRALAKVRERTVLSTNVEESRDETVRRLAREIIAARAVLAPDVSTAGTPLDEVARTALRVARATSVAAELRWWVEPGNAPGQDMVPRALLAKRAAGLDPGGGTPQGRQPPTPSLSHDDFEVRGTEDAKAGHPDEVLAALRVADQGAANLIGCQTTRGEDALQVLARAVRAYGEEPDDAPDVETEQVAREAMHGAITAAGWDTAAAADLVEVLARAGFVPGVYPPGMAIDGDMLRSLITDALPRWATDEFAGELANSVLDAAVRAGFTILHGTNLTPRSPAEPEQHWAEQAIERAREYLASLGYRRIVDDHGEDLVAMLREIGVAADSNSTRLALIDEHLVPLGIVASSDDRIVDGVGQLAQQYVELRERATRIGSPAGGGIFEISRERTSQQYEGGYTLQHDDQHTGAELLHAAYVYLGAPLRVWPWPDNPPSLDGSVIELLAKGGALVAAEIDRLRRVENRAAATSDDGVVEVDIHAELDLAAVGDITPEPAPMDVDGAWCNDVDDLWRCTRTPGHSGQHVARDSGERRALHVWPQGGAS